MNTPIPLSIHAPDEAFELVDEMVNDDENRWAYAYNLLDGIKKTIERTGRVTAAQWQAIENIKNANRRR